MAQTGADRSSTTVGLPAQLLVLAKEPLPGLAKTRLTPPLTPVQAAEVARAALLDTLDVVAAVPLLRRTVVLDGSPVGLVPAGFAVLPQRGGDLGDRLAGAFTDAYAALPVPMLLIGMDTPQVTVELLRDALDALQDDPAGSVLGLADDGGWWALGLHAPLAGLFDGVPMSTDRTGAAQLERLRLLGLPVTPLATLRDLDHVHDLPLVAAGQPPGARLASLTAELGLGDPGLESAPAPTGARTAGSETAT